MEESECGGSGVAGAERNSRRLPTFEPHFISQFSKPNQSDSQWKLDSIATRPPARKSGAKVFMLFSFCFNNNKAPAKHNCTRRPLTPDPNQAQLYFALLAAAFLSNQTFPNATVNHLCTHKSTLWRTQQSATEVPCPKGNVCALHTFFASLWKCVEHEGNSASYDQCEWLLSTYLIASVTGTFAEDSWCLAPFNKFDIRFATWVAEHQYPFKLPSVSCVFWNVCSQKLLLWWEIRCEVFTDSKCSVRKYLSD